MAFDQNSISRDLRPTSTVKVNAEELRIPTGRTPEAFYANVTASPSVPVYYVPATSDGKIMGLGPANPGQFPGPGVTVWGTNMPSPQLNVNPSGSVQNSNSVVRINSNGTNQGSEDGGEDSVSGKKVKFLCGFGGKILPRPSDGMLRYVGGQTRIISLRRDASFADLVQKMVDVYGQPVGIKYQLPDEDLDALVSVSCQDDLENMMDEYEKLLERLSDGSAKLRVFLFSASELESSGLVQFADPLETGQRYVDAVNGVAEVGAVPSGITRRGSMASATSTQNSDLSGADPVDASILGQDTGGPPSSNLLSPRSDTVVTTDGPLNPTVLVDTSRQPSLVPMTSGVSPSGLSQPETLFERSLPHPPAQQPNMGFELKQPSAKFPPPPSHYMQGFVDPQQDPSGGTEYQKHPPQMIYSNSPQMLAANRPVFVQSQYAGNVPAIMPQQFIPAPRMTVDPPSTHLSVNPSMIPTMMHSQLVAVPADQGYNAYHAHQIPPGRVAGHGWHQVPTAEGWMPHQHVVLPENAQKIDDCMMCQKQLPHSHSDGMVLGQRDSNVADVNSMYQSLRLEDVARFHPINRVAVPSQPEVGISRNLETHSEGERISPEHSRMLAPQDNPGLRGEVQNTYGIAIGNESPVGTVPPVTTEHLFLETPRDFSGHPVSRDDLTGPVVSHEQVKVTNGMLESQRLSQPETLPVFGESKYAVDQPSNEEILAQQSQQMLGGEQFSDSPYNLPALVPEANPIQPMASAAADFENIYAVSSVAASNWNGNVPESANSLFVNQDPWNIRQESQFPPPRPSKIAMRREAPAATRDPFFDDGIGNGILDPNSQPLNNLSKECSLEQPLSNQGSSNDLIKQELQATAEGVAASVLQSSLTSSADAYPDVNEGREIQNNSDAAKQGMSAESEKPILGYPHSGDLGRLQIIQNTDLEELRELGSGTFGTVYHGKWRGTDVAIKRINDRCFAGKPSEQDRMREDFWNEAIKLADLHHPNVVAFYGIVLDGPGGSVATVTEYMVNGSLRSALHKNEKSLDKRKRLLIAMDVAFGMEYLHAKNIVHFDLKSDNLLVNLRDPHRPICKVGDLGLSKVKCQTLISGGVRGTLPWMAPELLNGSSSLVSEKVDVFSFGIVMWEILTGEEPYSDLHYGAIIGGIVSNSLRPPVPDNCDPEWRSLMEKCWSAEPSERPNFTEIANELRLMASKIPPKGQAAATNARANAQGV